MPFLTIQNRSRSVVAAVPQNGTAWTFKGLCEFKLKNYDRALSDLAEARAHGVIDVQEIADVARYHSAILLTRIGQYDQALLTLSDFGVEGKDSPSIIEAMGLAVLRMPMLPAATSLTWIIGWIRITARPDADGISLQLVREDAQAQLANAQVTGDVFNVLDGPVETPTQAAERKEREIKAEIDRPAVPEK